MPKHFTIITPCYNEQNVVKKFLTELEQTLTATDCHFTIIVVNDASTDNSLELLRNFKFSSPTLSLKILDLKYNMGHQEAIRNGLNYADHLDQQTEGIIVMDSDGEDDPKAILKLVQLQNFEIVFVERGKRKENLSFRIGYFFYKRLFRVITGKRFAVGNYSMISPRTLHRVANQPFFHYAGLLYKQKLTISTLKYDRRKRLDGQSKMSYQNLVFHGLYALVEYAEELLFLLLKIFIGISCIIFALSIYVLYVKFITHTAIPGWASYIGINLVTTGMIIISTFILGLFLLSIKKAIYQNNEQHQSY